MRNTLAAIAMSCALSGCFFIVPIGTSQGSNAPSVEAAPEPTVTIQRPTSAFRASAEAEFNRIRADRGLGPVRFDNALYTAALTHAQDMAREGFRSHRGSDGSNFSQRARRAGTTCARAENIQWGSDTVGAAFGWWVNSPAHYQAMVNRQAQTFGLARVNDIWVLVIGRC